MKKWYMQDNGLTIMYGETEEILRNHPTAEEIPDKPGEGYIWDPAKEIWTEDPTYYRAQRAFEYPKVGDQLDALLKQFVLMDPSLEICPELDIVMSKWQEIKNKYPKPKDK